MCCVSISVLFCFFFFNDTATTEIYTLSLHDALPICSRRAPHSSERLADGRRVEQPDHARLREVDPQGLRERRDRKSTRLNSSHSQISYAVFCLKKKKNNKTILNHTISHAHT